MIFQHYENGKQYLVISFFQPCKAPNELWVEYQEVGGLKRIWSRPCSEFFQVVQVGEEPVPRFQIVDA